MGEPEQSNRSNAKCNSNKVRGITPGP